MPINTSGLSGYAKSWAEAYNSNGGNTTAASTSANQASYGANTPNANQQAAIRSSLGVTGNPATTGGSSHNNNSVIGNSNGVTYGSNGNFTYNPNNDTAFQSALNGGSSNTQPNGNGGFTPSSNSGGSSNGYATFDPNTDKKAALGRDQYMYNVYQNLYNQTHDPSMLQNMNNAASYGQQLRQQLGLGSTGGDYRSYYDVNKYGLQANPTTQMSAGDQNAIQSTIQQMYGISPNNPNAAQNTPAVQPQSLTPEQIQQIIAQQMQGFLNPASQINTQQIQQYAQQTADAQANAQKSALQNLLNQYQQQYNTSVSTINNSTDQAKQALDNKYFQNYLAARDQMADRGLAGSGLANDQNTRLLLAKQQDLSGIYQDANTRLSDAMGQWNNQSDNTYNQMSQINPALTADQTFQQMYQDAIKNQLDANKTGSSFLQNMFGYIAPDQNHQLTANVDMFKWNNASADAKLQAQTQARQLGFDMYKFNNLSADQKATIAQDLYKFNNLSADQKIQAQQKWVDLGIMQQNANTGAYSAQTGRLNYQETVQRDLSTANNQIGQLNNAQLQHQASGLESQLQAASSQLDNARTAYMNNSSNADAKAAYDQAQQVYDRARSGLDTLLKLNGQQGLPDPSMVGFPTSGTPSGSFSNFQLNQ